LPPTISNIPVPPSQPPILSSCTLLSPFKPNFFLFGRAPTSYLRGRAFATRFLASAFSRLLKELKQRLYPSRSSPPLPHCLCRFSGIASTHRRGKLRGKSIRFSARYRTACVDSRELHQLIGWASCVARAYALPPLPHDCIVWQQHAPLPHCLYPAAARFHRVARTYPSPQVQILQLSKVVFTFLTPVFLFVNNPRCRTISSCGKNIPFSASSDSPIIKSSLNIFVPSISIL
jgi:hypothetical protein